MKILLSTMLLAAVAMGAKAQSPESKKNVDKLCGCYQVEFKYAETFSPDKEYKFHDREEINGGIELTFPVEVSEKKIVMQHLLAVSDDMIIKHWREDWTYENPIIWKYVGDRTWVKETLKPEQVKGKWTQSVWEVSDAPRYQGISEWVNTDNKIFWQNSVDAPLPRREYTVRSDYNILKRTNRLVLNDSGYSHEQDNQKVIRKDGKDKLLVEERGINSYVKTDDKNCANAKAWWEKNKEYWTKVKIVWDKYLDTHNVVVLKDRVDGKVMHQNLMAMASEYEKGKIPSADIDARIKASFEKYVSDNKEVVQVQ